MKIILLFGPGVISKRNESLRIRKSFASPAKIIDLEDELVATLQIELLSHSLFEVGLRLVVVENPPEILDLEQLRGEETVTLLLLAGNLKSDCLLLKSAQKLKAKIIPFEGERELSVFPFLDALIEGKKSAFVELSKLLRDYGGVYIITMIYYLLRRNFLPQSSDFVQKKVKLQKAKFTEEDWLRLYRLVLENDYALKSGLGLEKVILTNLVSSIVRTNQTG